MISDQTSCYKVLDGLGDKLIHAGLITLEQLAVARVSKEDLGIDLAEILIQKKFVTEEEILKFLSRELNIPYLSLAGIELDLELVKNVPISLAKRYTLFPVAEKNGRVVVAMSNPLDLAAKDDLKIALRSEIEPVLSSRGDITEAIDRYYSAWNSPKVGRRIEREGHELEVLNSSEESLETSSERLQEIASGPKIVSTVNKILSRAYTEKASDVHIEPYRDLVRIRCRIDGFLEERETLPRQMHLPLISRIKIMAGLDIAERRIPQDGRIQINLLGNRLDLRISTYPTMKGEKVAIRLLSKENLINIEDLGFNEKERKLFADLIGKNYGLFLVTGPTGSGKSTTLYAGLTRVNSADKNIVSIEDPVESELPGINQAQ
ncbi:MAG: ATPase, T2SS/T4P/T4SS family, partial [Deltaproteobacteria bacterium]|nr:ATPase, T2SS/T4P/T4SS family [Deltaproteobacteria bacterium]